MSITTSYRNPLGLRVEVDRVHLSTRAPQSKTSWACKCGNSNSVGCAERDGNKYDLNCRNGHVRMAQRCTAQSNNHRLIGKIMPTWCWRWQSRLKSFEPHHGVVGGVPQGSAHSFARSSPFDLSVADKISEHRPRRAVSEGEVALRVRKVADGRDWAELAVADTGIGLTDEAAAPNGKGPTPPVARALSPACPTRALVSLQGFTLGACGGTSSLLMAELLRSTELTVRCLVVAESFADERESFGSRELRYGTSDQ